MRIWRNHPSEDVLEEYALKRLGETDLAPLEEHLLVCELCQDKLQGIDEFMLAMKLAEPEVSQIRPRLPRVTGFLESLTSRRAVLAGTVAALSIVAFIEIHPRTPQVDPVAVTLTSLRGNAGYAATAPARHPLALEIRALDITSCQQCKVEIADGSGTSVWSGTIAVSGGRLMVQAPVALAPGAYWVRLYNRETELLREFGLRLQ